MALIEKLSCPHCGFETEETAGSYLYTVAAGQHVVLGHPVEGKLLKRATGLEWHEAREQGLLRCMSYCICFACTAKFYLDIDREEKKCSQCGSHEVRTFTGSVAEECPACHAGKLALLSVGVS